MIRSRPSIRLFIGSALALALIAAAPAAAAEFGFRPSGEGLSASATREGGAPDPQAGSHPVALTTTLNLNLAPESPGQPGVPFTEGDLKDLSLELPPGLIEDPSAVPQCTQGAFHSARQSPFEASLSGESCPDRTQIGTVEVRSSYGGGSTRTFGVFNLDPAPGAPSELGFSAYGAPITFVPRIRQAEGEYGLTLETNNVPQLVDISGLTLTIWGAPWAIVHNSQRGNCLNEAEPSFGWAKCSVGPPAENPAVAYLTLPTDCTAPLSLTATADSWAEPARQVSRTFTGPNLEGCGNLRFQPEPVATVINPHAASPSGYDFDLDVDNSGFLEPARLAPSPVKQAIVALPDGMTINPSVGAGLGSCSASGYAAETSTSPPGAGCPNASKIGDFTVQSPLFPETLEGSLFLASPNENPFGTLLAVYLVAKAPARGILVKVAGKLEADQSSGRLVATFENLPQIPYTNLRIHFREGQRSPLATPASCGSYATQITLTPWRGAGAQVQTSSSTSIASGPGSGPCPASATPFAPGASAGSINSNAGSYSPFYIHLTRSDLEQEITGYSTILPPGLLGKLAGIPYCSNAAIEAAKHESGFGETARPSCPAASQIGHTSVGYGVGPVLSYAPGGLYLAGPFHGAPFSIVALNAATVGPFDLGTVVIRSAIDVDPLTAQVSIDSAGSDPIPHIIDGIPLHLRDIRVYIDRPDFTVNPTSCEPFTVTSRLEGSGQLFSDPADDISVSPTNRYQAFNCGALGFKPKFSLRLKGGTTRGKFPALRAEVRPRPGDANIAGAVVTLPPSEFLEQRHIKTICTRPQFTREDCPAASVYGTATAVTPLLGAPLEGKVYLRSSENKLPDLVAALRGGGDGLKIDLDGRIDAYKGGLRTTFEGLPDGPVTKFTMKLFGGKRGLLVNSENTCATEQRATAKFTGQNRVPESLRTPLTVECGKKKKGSGGKGKGKGGHRG